MTTPQQISDKKPWPWLKIALAISVGVNLLVVGFLVGALVRQGASPADRGPGLGAFGAPYMLALPAEKRRDIIRELRVSRPDAVPDRRARREMFSGVIAQLRAEPFDPVALEDAVSRQAEVAVFVQQRAKAAWLDVIKDMTDAERLLYADTVEDVLKRKRKR